MSVAVWVGIAVLGGVGAITRFLFDAAVEARFDRAFPLGTFVVNLCGSFALGMLTGFQVGGSELLLAGTATLGSFTTFSTWMLESERLGEDGELTVAAMNVAFSLVLGFAAATCGWGLGSWL
jgi:fluoride exporter